MRIAIVDDERPARSELRHQIQELLKEAEIVEGDSGAAALQIAGDGKYELFFLDINLGDISGTVLVNAIHINIIPVVTGCACINRYILLKHSISLGVHYKPRGSIFHIFTSKSLWRG